MKKPDLKLRGLNSFIGTTKYYRYHGVLLTDGVKYIMENGYSWFVTDAIIVIKMHKRIREYLRHEDFLTIKLTNLKDHECDMIITNGNDKVLYKHHYELTDAERELKLFFTGNVLMLASEY